VVIKDGDMNKPAIKETPTVANAEEMLARFETERQTLIERKAALADRRRDHAYDAAAGNAAAAKQLDAVHREAVEIESRIANSDAAIAEAKHRLEIAKQREAHAAERAKAVELRAVLKQFVEHGAGCDAALELLVESCNGMERTLVEIHRCGSAFPSDAQLLSLGSRVLMAALSKTTFRREFPAVPPLERNRTMTAIVQQWADTVERGIRERLGDQTNETVEAAE
jgi:hypothetical protein